MYEDAEAEVPEDETPEEEAADEIAARVDEGMAEAGGQSSTPSNRSRSADDVAADRGALPLTSSGLQQALCLQACTMVRRRHPG